MNGYEYEEYCATWLKKQGFHNIQVTQASKDQGIDIIASKNRKRYGFQCKFYENPVGNDAVQQAFTGAAYYNCDVACVITNTTFTRSAITLSKETDVILIDSIIPEKESFLSRSLKYYSLLLMILGIGLFVYESKFLQYHDASILASCFLILSSLTGLFSIHSSICLWISSFSSLISFILSFQYQFIPSNHLLIFQAFLLIYHICFDIQIILNKKQENITYHKNIESEIQEQLDQTTKQKGEKLASILSEEIHHPITFMDYKIEESSILYRFKSTLDLSNDFALLEYSLNQYATYTNSTDVYTFQKISPKTFQVIVNNSHNKNKESL